MMRVMKESSVPEPGKVFCEVCLKEVPRSEASMAEARDYVAYFCGLDCYDKWQHPAASPEEPKPEIQEGAGGRSKSREDRLKRVLNRNPQRDEPRVDSVEPEEKPLP